MTPPPPAQAATPSASVAPSSAPTLAAAAGRNARWLAVGQAARVGLQLVGVVLLSRLLPPADFGLVAMVVAVTSFALLWRDLGTATAIVRGPELGEPTLSSVFWLNLGIGSAIAVLLVLLRHPLAALLGDARLAPLLLLVAPSFVLQGAAAVPQALLERACRFRALAAIEMSAGVAGLAAAVAGAIAGWGARSLIVQTLVSAAIALAGLLLASHWRPQPLRRLSGLRGLLHFSGHLTAFNVINHVTRNADSVVIGRVLGPAALGPYSLIMRVTLFPVQNLTWAASRALLPVLGRQQKAPGEAAALYLRSVSLIAMFSAPLMGAIWVLRGDFVAVALGPQWGTSADLLLWLAPVGFVQSIVSTVGPVFLASGRSDVLMRLGLLSLALVLAGLLLGVQFGVLAVAALYLCANLLQAVPCLLAATRQLGLRFRVLLRRLLPPVAGALVMVGLLAALQRVPLVTAWPALLRLLVLGGLGAAVYGLTAWFFNRQALLDALRVAHLRRG